MRKQHSDAMTAKFSLVCIVLWLPSVEMGASICVMLAAVVMLAVWAFKTWASFPQKMTKK